MKQTELSILAPYTTILGKRLDQTISKIFLQYSRSCLKNWIINNRVYVNGEIENKPDKKILGGEKITIYPIVKEITPDLPENIFLNIIYEDNNLLVINKSAGLVVHPGAGNDNGTILNALLYRYETSKYLPRCGIVHRLDKNTSGLMVIAKTIFAYYYLVKLLKSKTIVRKYQAIVKGNMISGGIIDYPIMRHPTKRICMIVHPSGKPAITHYKIIHRFKFHTHILLKLETGRTHQIRVHMLHIRYPVLGDPLYRGINYSCNNFKKKCLYKNKIFSRQALHAHHIEFFHPITNKLMSWKIDLPNDMKNLILDLNK
ncbi:23S rRNA pseudouridine(1911/1915/1917) synthase RluD [Buchnera aphidicola (Aphis helianthi)]|uniref:Pseudouridine synthase n=1 Tax=Buchnera aphidicola (Aphis helianthi) TaxID=2315802 RepID=A0A4D6XX28_9GAMM|nr:23S rRNA pseudouridine(1911/1915/1917) synthase RluD [Buchnera aphidicola]QCI17215.1 23S rRNA pseudouridine(1911/1915/1917) synthase RluD [Buchnera aphidicola (Aphis helianthi)]